jgi:spermidine/putrescine transport system ATP-binding protein
LYLDIMSAPAVEVVNVRRSFGNVVALDEVSLSIGVGEFFSLLGPSGCGKTTLLRLIAGLDLPDSGCVRIGGQDVTGTAAHHLPVNTVFQSYALFPHLDVHENVAFGLRMKKVSKSQIAERVGRVMELVRIADLAERRPHQLSGGQKQRVALARAIVNEPQVVLLDEPLGALDFQLRKQLQIELRALQRRLGITFIYVTHDQEEALAMSDRIALMNAGHIEQIGTVVNVYERPRNRFVAEFLGSCNILEATVERYSDGTAWARTLLGTLQVDGSGAARGFEIGDNCLLAIRPEKVRLLFEPVAEANCIAARVTELTYRGSETQYRLQTAAGLLEARKLNVGHERREIGIGQMLTAQLPPASLTFLED